jgi:phage baseplate assembly protein W
MAIRKKTLGINFPFRDSNRGDFLDMSETPEVEIKTNLVHLLTTKKGTRYFMPEFGTNLHRFIFEPIDDITNGEIENEIIDAVDKFLPNIKIDKVNILQFKNDPEFGDTQLKHLIKITLDYRIQIKSFDVRDSVTFEL